MAAMKDGITVKNTFIEIDDDFLELENRDMGRQVTEPTFAWKRQVSEPTVAWGRQVSDDQAPSESQVSTDQPEEEESESDAELAWDSTRSTKTTKSTFSWADESESAEEEGPFETQGDLKEVEPTQEGTDASKKCENVNKEESGSTWTASPMNQGMAFQVMVPWCGMDYSTMQYVPMGDFGGSCMMRPTTVFEPAMPAMPEEAVQQFHVPEEWRGVNTVMMRNLPNRYTQPMLLQEVCDSGFTSTFDFFYLSIDPETNANKGYAFINFVNPIDSWRFTCTFRGRQMKFFNSKKFVSVSPATLQGFEANYAHYSTLRCSFGDPSARPLFYRKPDASASTQRLTKRGGQQRRTERGGKSLVDMAAQKMGRQGKEQAAQKMGQQGTEQASSSKGQKKGFAFCPWCGAAQPGCDACQACGRSFKELFE